MNATILSCQQQVLGFYTFIAVKNKLSGFFHSIPAHPLYFLSILLVVPRTETILVAPTSGNPTLIKSVKRPGRAVYMDKK
jgi:hypothetical protein